MFSQLGAGADLGRQLASVKDARLAATAGATLRGRRVTTYTLVSSESALMTQLAEDAPSAQVREALRARFQGGHVESVVWVDGGYLPLRVDTQVIGSKLPPATSTVTCSGWGTPVTITAPPREDVLDLGD